MNKQLGKKILLVAAAVMAMILLSSFKMQNEGDRSLKKIVLNKNKSVEYTVDVGKMGLLKYWLEPNVFSVALRCQTEDDTLKLRCETEGVDAVVARMNLQYKVPLQCDDEFFSRLWLEKQGVRYVFHQDIFRAKDEKLCLKATVELVCLINGKLGNSEDYDKAFEKYYS